MKYEIVRVKKEGSLGRDYHEKIFEDIHNDSLEEALTKCATQEERDAVVARYEESKRKNQELKLKSGSGYKRIF